MYWSGLGLGGTVSRRFNAWTDSFGPCNQVAGLLTEPAIVFPPSLRSHLEDLVPEGAGPDEFLGSFFIWCIQRCEMRWREGGQHLGGAMHPDVRCVIGRTHGSWCVAVVVRMPSERLLWQNITRANVPEVCELVEIMKMSGSHSSWK